MRALDGKVAVVTGGSSGIGFATAERFVKEGAYVFITGRRQKEIDQAASTLGDNARAIQGDVSSLEDLDRLFQTIRREKGRIDVLVANSGIMDPTPLVDVTVSHFDAIFDVNAKGVLFTVQKALPLMPPGSSIVLISSVVSGKGLPGYGTYSATKASVRSFARTWTRELKDRRIRVNSLSPGPVDTAMIDARAVSSDAAAQLRAGFASLIPLGRMGRAEEIAAAALFLASDESSFIAGIDLCVDGGMAQV
ncbi:SDR family NAD(P)-dependent oxidoreductase [Caballeronia sp. 15715]|uniref:SDR family NAD(P)-dependent oxidoreductase n=1 Tax=Caballeronia sp. 15715 TaxID=3391030 RepID=UPI0039E70674